MRLGKSIDSVGGLEDVYYELFGMEVGEEVLATISSILKEEAQIELLNPKLSSLSSNYQKGTHPNHPYLKDCNTAIEVRLY
jgi:hypothetical protein